jgi:O-antigen/teichoic acid export membrane protein
LKTNFFNRNDSLINVSDRSSILRKNIFETGILKLASMVLSFLTVPIILNAIGQKSYGIWLTLSAIFTWINYFDIGLGSGLRNKFAESKAIGNLEKTKHYVSTSYVVVGMISLGFIIILFLINPFLKWNSILNTTDISGGELNTIIMIIFPLFCFQFFLRLISSILIGDQKSSTDQLLTFLTSAGIIISILLIQYFNSIIDLLAISVIFSGLPVLVMLGATIYFFSSIYKNVRPSFCFVRMQYFNVIGSLGFKFFIIQICSLVTVATSNIIISQLFTPEDVVPYNLAYKYFFYLYAVFGLIINPLYGAFPNAFAKKDYNWIRDIIQKINKISVMAIFTIILMIAISPIFFRFWIGDTVFVPIVLVGLMGIYFSITISMTPYAVFISSVGAVKIAFIFSIINAVLHIPLSIILCKYLGVIGVVVAMIALSISGLLWLPIQTRKLLNGSSRGVWAIG